MITLTTEEARARFGDVINRAAYGNERTIVTKHGKTMAAVVSMADLELLERLAASVEDSIDSQACSKGLREAETEGTMSLDELDAELGL